MRTRKKLRGHTREAADLRKRLKEGGIPPEMSNEELKGLLRYSRQRASQIKDDLEAMREAPKPEPTTWWGRFVRWLKGLTG